MTREITPTPVHIFPDEIIVSVTHGTDENGYPFVRVRTKHGETATLTADGWSVDPTHTVSFQFD